MSLLGGGAAKNCNYGEPHASPIKGEETFYRKKDVGMGCYNKSTEV